MKRKMWNRFKDFLYEKDLLVAYWNATTNDKRKILKTINASDYLYSSFHWRAERENGLVFWMSINNEWKEILKREFEIL